MAKLQRIMSIFMVSMVISAGFFGFVYVTPEEVSGTTGGVLEAGAAATLAVALLSEVKDAINSLGKATAYAKAKTTGPDTDDIGVSLDWDSDRGLDWSLDAKTADLYSWNDVDDGEEDPYTSGDPHNAGIEVHFDYKGGVWVPDPDDCSFTPEGEKKKEYYGWAIAEEEDDPAKKGEITTAGAAAAFSADGKTVDFEYTGVGTSKPGGNSYNEVERRSPTRSSSPNFAFEQGAIYMMSPERFQIESKDNDMVVIRPLMDQTIDLFHIYLQQNSSKEVYPVMGGIDEIIREIRDDAYTERFNGTDWILTEEGNADLTIVGAALRFNELEMVRGQQSDEQLLTHYFSSEDAVSVISPSHSQEGYEPNVTIRSQIKSGQNISGMVDRQYIIADNKKPGSQGDPETMIGIFVAVKGEIDEAVELGANTEGHFIKEIADAAMPTRGDTVDFTVPSLNFHYEASSSFSDIAIAGSEIEELPTRSISDILGSGTVVDDIEATGSASGLVAHMGLTSNSDIPVTFGITPSGLEGMVLVNPNNDEQDLVIYDIPGVYPDLMGGSSYQVKPEITLNPGEKILLPVIGYCINYDLGNPTVGIGLGIGDTSEKTDIDKVIPILDAIKDTDLSENLTPIEANQLTQVTIWAGQPENHDEDIDHFSEKGYDIDDFELAIIRDILDRAGIDTSLVQLFSSSKIDTDVDQPDTDTTVDSPSEENQINDDYLLYLILLMVILSILGMGFWLIKYFKKK